MIEFQSLLNRLEKSSTKVIVDGYNSIRQIYRKDYQEAFSELSRSDIFCHEIKDIIKSACENGS
jgi:hypothetical protein